jgi:hypothetical protein
VPAHQSAKPSFEQGATARFVVANASYVPTDATASERRAPTTTVHDLGVAQPVEHPPHRGQVPEQQLPGPLLDGPRPVQGRDDVLGRAEVALGDDPRLAVHPGGLH